MSKIAKPLCTRQTVSLSLCLRFHLFCIFPAPAICYWVLQLLPPANVTNAACKPLPSPPLFPSSLPNCPLLLPDRPSPFLSVALTGDSVVEDQDTDNEKLSLRPAMLTLHSLLLGIHVSTDQPFTSFCGVVLLRCFVPLYRVLNNTITWVEAD